MANPLSIETVTAVEERTKPPFLRRVRIRGYKSIAFCEVSVEPLTILVGPNASGKSNFLDALAFLRDAIRLGVLESVKLHGGMRRIVFQPSGKDGFGMEFEFAISMPAVSALGKAEFGFQISTDPQGIPYVESEFLHIVEPGNGRRIGFRRQIDGVSWEGLPESFQSRPHRTADDLLRDLSRRHLLLMVPRSELWGYLVESIREMGFYNFNPEAIRRVQRQTPGSLLERDAANLASVIETTRHSDREAITRVGQYLSAITGTLQLLEVARYGEYETIRFRVDRNGLGQTLELDAASMSDGTLRALSALVAGFQCVPPHGFPSLIAIEEPETALHPAAVRALVDALDEATLRTQVLLTTHSPEMLDNPTIQPENILVVQMKEGRTVIARVDEASVEIVRRKLNSLGGLERDNLLEPDLDDLDRQQQLGQAQQELPA